MEPLKRLATRCWSLTLVTHIEPEDAPAFRRGEESWLGVLLASDIFLDHLQCCAASRKVVLVPPAYTTMTCSACHSKAKSRLPLNVRIFRCECCGHTDDRDRNAARVILVRAGFNPAGVDDVRLDHLRVAEQSESGIPRL